MNLRNVNFSSSNVFGIKVVLPSQPFQLFQMKIDLNNTIKNREKRGRGG
jgi:hypothetical protein